jgi:hypothetical protein
MHVFVGTPELVNAYLADLLLKKKRGRATCGEHSCAVADKRRLERAGHQRKIGAALPVSFISLRKTDPSQSTGGAMIHDHVAIGASTTYALTGAIGLSRLSKKAPGRRD